MKKISIMLLVATLFTIVPPVTRNVIAKTNINTTIEQKSSVTHNGVKIELSNYTDAGFDVTIKTPADTDGMIVHIWKSGHYYDKIPIGWDNGLTKIDNRTYTARVTYNRFGSGADYYYFGVHTNSSVNGAKFWGDIPVKVDVTAPVVNYKLSATDWTDKDIDLSINMSDNFNTLEDIKIYKENELILSEKIYAQPKILVIDKNNYDAGLDAMMMDYYRDVKVVDDSDITSVSQLKGYDLIVYDGGPWGIEYGLAEILNQTFEEGVSIYTAGNDSFSYISLVETSYGSLSNTVVHSQYTNNYDKVRAQKFDRVTEYINGHTLYDAFVPINTVSKGTTVIGKTVHSGIEAPSVLYNTHTNGNKWIHAHKGHNIPLFDKAVIDELMTGVSKKRMSYNEQIKLTENGNYRIIVTDSFGNKTEKTFRVTNIDKSPLTTTHNISPSTWTNKNVTISVAGKDDSGIKNIILPNGNSVANDKANYTVSKNGVYNFIISSNSGEAKYLNVKVSNIETQKPTVIIDNPKNNTWTNQNVEINITATDK